MKIIVIWIWASLMSMAVDCQNSGGQGASGFEDRNTSLNLKRPAGEEIMTLAGGCFWCMEEIYEEIRGVDRVISGYAGGHTKNPTYAQSNTGQTGHAESVQIYYNPDSVSFHTLLKVFFLVAHDPTQVDRQGPDVGSQYRSIAFYRTQEEKKMIEDYIAELNASGEFDRPFATEVKKLEQFYPAEGYHQDYYPQHPGNPYIQNVSRPKVEKFRKKFPELLK